MRIVKKGVKRDYEITKRFESGIVLTGAEAKSANAGRVDLSRAYGKLISGELFLVGAQIYVKGASTADISRTRKLMVHKRELNAIGHDLASKRLTLVPLALYNRGKLVKVELGLARSRRKHEKRSKVKARDIKRDTERELKDVTRG